MTRGAGTLRRLEASLTDCVGLPHNLDDEVQNLLASAGSSSVERDNVGVICVLADGCEQLHGDLGGERDEPVCEVLDLLGRKGTLEH